jgi:beta-lactamase class D
MTIEWWVGAFVGWVEQNVTHHVYSKKPFSTSKHKSEGMKNRAEHSARILDHTETHVS